MTPDEATRKRLRAFDPAGEAGLSDDERERIIATVRARGPALVRRAQTVSLAMRAGLASVAIAAAAVLMWLAPWRTEPLAHVPAVERSLPRACASDVMGARPQFVRQPDGRAVLELGARARAIADVDTEVALVSHGACTTTIALRRGALSVHARDLGGGQLEVHAGDTQVRVLGTLFRVLASQHSVQVAVEHGRVSVRRNGRELTSVAALESARVTESQVARQPLARAEAEALRQAFAPAAAVGLSLSAAPEAERPAQTKLRAQRRHARASAPLSAEASAEELVARAEARWRAGNHQAARELYRQAGEVQNSTGEAAWLRLARLELRGRHATAALAALEQHTRRFGQGGLSPEASWLEVEALALAGRRADAEARARALVASHPASAQAAAARRLLEDKP